MAAGLLRSKSEEEYFTSKSKKSKKERAKREALKNFFDFFDFAVYTILYASTVTIVYEHEPRTRHPADGRAEPRVGVAE
jgi:hypothetical protein